MPRFARVVIPDLPHHITHRGNRSDDVFFTPQDRDIYRELLREYSDRHALKIIAYCLMTNHIHLIAIPGLDVSLAKAVGLSHRRYSRFVNTKRNWTGHLWANRYYSTLLDEPHTLACIKYVEQNPMRAGLVSRAEDYPWSSARSHVYGIPDPLLSPDREIIEAYGIDDWSAWLSKGLEDDEILKIRRNTNTGWPTGSEEFVKRLEGMLGRRLTRLCAGRKRKKCK
ncbi:MAG: transposase [bacterium]|nr:transposase [bacterium]